MLTPTLAPPSTTPQAYLLPMCTHELPLHMYMCFARASWCVCCIKTLDTLAGCCSFAAITQAGLTHTLCDTPAMSIHNAQATQASHHPDRHRRKLPVTCLPPESHDCWLHILRSRAVEIPWNADPNVYTRTCCLSPANCRYLMYAPQAVVEDARV